MSDNGIDKDYQALKSDVAQLRGDLSALLNSISTEAKSKRADAGEHLKNKFTATKDQVGDKATQIGSEIRAHQEDKPLLFLLLAFLVGIVLGKVINSSK